MKRANLWLVLGVIALTLLPLCLPRPADEEAFSGADGQAEAAITVINPGYKPWVAPIFEPPSGEIESLLFALQAAIGAGVICFYLGLARGRALQRDAHRHEPATHP